jgi:hypothetical protein
LFPPIKSVVVDPPLTLFSYGGCVVVFLFLSSGFWLGDSTQEVQLGEWPASYVVDSMLWLDFKCFFSSNLKLDLRTSVDFC